MKDSIWIILLFSNILRNSLVPCAHFSENHYKTAGNLQLNIPHDEKINRPSKSFLYIFTLLALDGFRHGPKEIFFRLLEIEAAISFSSLKNISN